jgi:hypothetical protein
MDGAMLAAAISKGYQRMVIGATGIYSEKRLAWADGFSNIGACRLDAALWI